MHRFSNVHKTNTEIESLLRSNDIPKKYRWYPFLVSELEADLSHGIFDRLNLTIKKNIAYSLQYLEYIDLQLSELQFSDSLYCMLYKNYIITAAAIVESVFYHILFYYKKLKYQLYGEPILHDVKTYKEGEKTFVKVEGHKEKLNSPKEAVQDFHFLIISVLEGNYLNITDSKVARSYISYCKELRKRVHLHLNQEAWTSDYHIFSHKEYALVRYVLYRILSDPLFGREKQLIFPELEQESLNVIIKNRYNYNNG